MLNLIGKTQKGAFECSMKGSVSVHVLNEQMMCAGPDGFFQTGWHQPIRPYTCQIAKCFFYRIASAGLCSGILINYCFIIVFSTSVMVANKSFLLYIFWMESLLCGINFLWDLTWENSSPG